MLMDPNELAIPKTVVAMVTKRMVDDERFKALKASIKAHGVLQPVLINKKLQVVDGLMRVVIARRLGIKVPVHYV